ncbi:MAG: Lrp/AsnC family transcriptional regulator [Thermoprotei archaeon]|nr:MAG: Lrp/AsnC family transcriptional regulator [Thermoprotei archaeon]
MSTSSKLSAEELKAYNIIREESVKGGILQPELWKKLGINSKHGSRIILKLIKKGLVQRILVEHNGRRVYKLLTTTRSILVQKFNINLNLVSEIPCFLCREIDKCSLGNYFSPATCPKLTSYILTKLNHFSKT